MRDTGVLFHFPLGTGAAALALGASLSLTACGGGSSGAGTDSAQVSPPSNTAMASFSAGASMPMNFRDAAAVPMSLVAQAVRGLPADPGPVYLKVWVDDPATGEPRLLAFGRWTEQRALPRVQAPQAVGVIRFEVYNAAGSTRGEWSVQ